MTSAPRLARAAAALGLILSCLSAPSPTAAAPRAPELPSLATAEPSLSFSTAKVLAAREGKLLLVRFTAAWCAPCRLLEQTALVDEQVVAYLAEHYVSVVVDVDDFDGFALKQRFEVGNLPTLVFLSSESAELARITEGVGASALLKQLRAVDRPEHRRVVAVAPEAPAEAAEPTAAAKVATTDTAHSVRLQGPPPEHAEPLDYVSPAASPRPVLAAEGERAVATAMAPTRARLFSLQAGVYPNRPEAVRAAEQLRDDSGEAVLLEFDYAAGRPVYRLYVGRFADLSEGEALRRRLEGSGYELIGRELAMW